MLISQNNDGNDNGSLLIPSNAGVGAP